MLLAAGSAESRAEWLADIERVAHSARPTVLRPLSAPVTEGGGARGVAAVTWHRGVSVSLWNAVEAASNAHCGFLLRKFKSGNGWQRYIYFNIFNISFLKCIFYKKLIYKIRQSLINLINEWGYPNYLLKKYKKN